MEIYSDWMERDLQGSFDLIQAINTCLFVFCFSEENLTELKKSELPRNLEQFIGKSYEENLILH